jgi:DNA polymerase-3 subunit gamma/tau
MLGSAGLSRAADLFHDGLTEMRGTTAPRLLLELVCARVLLPAASDDPTAVLTRIERLERRLDIAGTPAPAAAPPPVASGSRSGGVAPVPGRNDVAPPAPAAPAAPTAPAAPAASTASAAPAAPAWPTPATLGEPAAQSPEPAAAAPDESPGAAGLDAAALRRSWDAVLDAVKTSKRVTHARLLDAQVLALSGRRLQLGFSTPTLAKQFAEGVHVDVLKEALVATVGADLDVHCTVAGAAAATASAAADQQAPAGQVAPPPYDGFAPGDEAVPDDPDASPPPTAALNGEEAALALVQSELGGKVVETLGE